MCLKDLSVQCGYCSICGKSTVKVKIMWQFDSGARFKPGFGAHMPILCAWRVRDSVRDSCEGKKVEKPI